MLELQKQHKIGFVFYNELHRSSESKHTVRCNSNVYQTSDNAYLIIRKVLLLFGCECTLHKLITREIQTIPHLLLNIQIVIRDSGVTEQWRIFFKCASALTYIINFIRGQFIEISVQC